jgi:RecF/RecN/SMC N terminal domain
MKVLELEISDLRGIRHLALQPQGQNLVIWGPNGSGKSAVIDAVDFLFTGRMRRLIGEGTAGITLKKHGPHIDAGDQNPFVRGVVRFSDGGPTIELTRRLPKNELEISPDPSKDAAVALEIASRGQNILTRREILRFVTADAGTRGEQIQALLDLVSVETTRKALGQVENRCKERWGEATAAWTQARSRLALVLGVEQPENDDVVAFINKKRAIMGAAPVPSPAITELKLDIASPDGSLPAGVNQDIFDNHRKILRQHFSPEGRHQLEALADALASSLSALDAYVARKLKRRALVSSGLDLLDDSGVCPLCETPWDSDALRLRLEERKQELTALSSQLNEATTSAQKLAQHLSVTTTALDTILALLEKGPQPPNSSKRLMSANDLLHKQLTKLQSPIEGSIDSFEVDQVVAPYLLDGLDDALEDSLQAAASLIGTVSDRVKAWDALTILEEAIKSSTEAGKVLRVSSEVYKRAQLLSSTYRDARDAVLQELYDSIRERFVELYKALHTPDESSFSADLLPKGAGIDFLVDFYGRGNHPPHALHSEGHQDSMGLCLFLALLERLSDNRMNLVLLDDVVMSVDADHRRRVGKILRSLFPDVQFIITTHDRTWANQLRTEKVVTSGNTVQFYGWNLDTGPRVLYEGDLWDQIEASLDKDDVAAASHRLRRGAEEYFQSVCDALRAKVRYSLGARLELGDFAPAAMSRLRDLLKVSKKSANSWNAGEKLAALEEIESTAKQVFARTNVERWAINDTVHYNAWENLSATEFKPVVEAFQDLFDLFRCTTCGTMLRVETAGHFESTVRCDCGSVSWNLTEKKSDKVPTPQG